MDIRKRKKVRPSKADNEGFAIPTKPKRNGTRICFKLIVFITLALMTGLVLGYCFSPIKALPFDELFTVSLSGIFEPNKKLTNGSKIPNLNSPESIEADDDGNLYAGLQDGRIVKIHRSSNGEIGKGRIENITSGIIHNTETTDGSKRGRPMGLRLRGNTLVVMDAVYGVYKVNVKTKDVIFILKPSDVDPPMKFPNDLDITHDGKMMYFTDASMLHPLSSMIGAGIMDGSCTGRVFRYSFEYKEVDTLVKDLCFGNGVQLSMDEKIIMIPETSRLRISFFNTDSGKRKKVIALPMMPDNVRRGRKGTYFVSGANVLTPMGKKILRGPPALRQALAGLLPTKVIMSTMHYTIQIHHNILVEIKENGDIIGTLQDPDGELIYGLSQATELNDGRLVLGSYAAPNAAIVWFR